MRVTIPHICYTFLNPYICSVKVKRRKYQAGGQVDPPKVKKKELTEDVVFDYLSDSRSGGKFSFRDVANKIAFHETGGTMDPKQPQILKGGGTGPGYGKYQIEPNRLLTMQSRVEQTADALGYENPSWNKPNLKLKSLTEDQQDLLMASDMLMGPHETRKLVSGNMSLEDFWANYHWIGKPETRAVERPDRIRAFRSSMGRYNIPSPKDKGKGFAGFVFNPYY